MDTSSMETKKKSFWSKPEGTTGMIFGVGLLGALGWGLYKLLPYIITLLQNAIYATVLGVVLFVMIWVLMDKRFWTLGWYLYKSIMRKITSMFIMIDPIGILKSYITYLEDQRTEMQEQITRLRGEMGKLMREIKMTEAERANALDLMKQAKQAGKQAQLVLQSRQAGRLEKSELTYNDLYRKMELLYRVLVQMREATDIVIQDIKGEVNVREREYNAVRAGHSAIKAAMSIMKGQNDKREIFEQTMQYLVDDYGQKIGEIEEFVDLSANFLDSIDLQNGVYEEKALAMLEQWEKAPESILLGSGKKQIIAATNDPTQVLNIDEEPRALRLGQPEKDETGSRYRDLL